ncbi:MAG: hypothetical protein OEZ02_00485 [Anaerolineae bacterium]|nr:hypothetical protein [Anaerolineae bacterium]
MWYIPHIPLAAHAAAEERKRRRQMEEEEMTSYSPEDIQADWEFKIVRSSTAAFRNQQIFANLLEEEALAGWEMVEKLDDQRVRFKRKRSERRYDDRLPPEVDPYRTQYGSNSNAVVSLIVLVLGLLMALGMGIFLMIGTGPSPAVPIASTVIFILPAIVILMILVGMVAFIRRR